MTRPSKWIKMVSADDRVSDVAVRSLDASLGAVAHYLPLAANRPEEDIEYVHQLRVWTRRATAAVNMYRELLPRREAKWFTKQLQRVRRAADGARDFDVFKEYLVGDMMAPGVERLLEQVSAHRCQAQRPIIEVYERLAANNRFKRRMAKLLRKVRFRPKKAEQHEPFFVQWARQTMQSVVRRFFEAAQADIYDVDLLHRFRIRGKKLRYGMELLAGAYPPSFRRRLYSVVKELQTKLGELNDHVVAEVWCQNWIEQSHDSETIAHLHERLIAERELVEKCRDEFFRWWTQQRQHDLQRKFDKMLTNHHERAKRR